MYTGSYYEGEGLTPPKGYDGCAFTQSDQPQAVPLEAKCAPPKVSPQTPLTHSDTEEYSEDKKEEVESAGLFSSLFERIPFKGLLMGRGGAGSLLGFFKKITGEEILLLGVALILLFSSDGDKTLALILLALLFVD